MSTPLAVDLSNIWKRFPGVIANAGASLQVKQGTIHAVLGENGAGKSTLMNVLAGMYRPDEGEIRIGGSQHWFRSPSDALAAGIGMVHQEFRLVPSFTVAENIVLGASERIIRKGSIESKVEALAQQFSLNIDPARQSGSCLWENDSELRSLRLFGVTLRYSSWTNPLRY